MEYEKLNEPKFSCLAMMMFVQTWIEIEGVSPGWGDAQCKFLTERIASDVSYENCMNQLRNADGEYYQKVYRPADSKSQIQVQFDFRGNLENQVLGLKINIKSFTHNIVAGLSVDTDCTSDIVYRRPSKFDVLAHNESAIVKFEPTWNATDNFASCDEEWTNKKETVCGAVWILEKNPESVPEFQITVSEIVIADVYRSARPIGPKSGGLKSGGLKSAKSVKSDQIYLCDIYELTKPAYDEEFKDTLSDTSCSINNVGTVTCINGYELTPEDCKIVDCGPAMATIAMSAAIAGGIFTFALIVFGIFYYIKKKRTDGPVYSEPSNIVSNKPQKHKNNDNEWNFS